MAAATGGVVVADERAALDRQPCQAVTSTCIDVKGGACQEVSPMQAIASKLDTPPACGSASLQT